MTLGEEFSGLLPGRAAVQSAAAGGGCGRGHTGDPCPMEPVQAAVPRAGRPRLARNVVVVVSFFQDAASELVYPVLPLF